jgi:hypothetical protein
MYTSVLPCIFPIPYGCWCGLNGPFPGMADPIDNFDQLCKDHDLCFDKGRNELKCSWFDMYVRVYNWDLTDRKVRTSYNLM